MISCVYTITGKIDGKILVGYTTNFDIRRRTHIYTLIAGKHDNPHLQNYYNKYGKNSVDIEILEEYPPEILPAMEHYWAIVLDAHNRNHGFNILPTHPLGKNKTLSEESKKKISKANLGRHCKHSPEAIERKRIYSLREENVIRMRELQKETAKRRIGLHHTKDSKLRMVRNKFGKNRIIEIYNLQSELMHTCDFQTEASNLTGVKRSAISNNLIGLSKTAGGYIFKYREV